MKTKLLFLVSALSLVCSYMSAQNLGAGFPVNLKQYQGATLAGPCLEFSFDIPFNSNFYAHIGVGYEILSGDTKVSQDVLTYINKDHTYFKDVTTGNQLHKYKENDVFVPILFGYKKHLKEDDSFAIAFFAGPILAYATKATCDSYIGGFSISQDYLAGTINTGSLTDSYVLNYMNNNNLNTPQNRFEIRAAIGMEFLFSKQHGITIEYQRGFRNKAVSSEPCYSNILKFGYQFHFLRKTDKVSRDF